MCTILVRSFRRPILAYSRECKIKLVPTFLRNFTTDLETNEPEISDFLGAQSKFTTEMVFQSTNELFPCFRRLNRDGSYIGKNSDMPLSTDEIIKRYKTMCKLNVMDGVFYDAQRQGRISFYMTHYGEEAIQVGSASALDPDDIVYAQYREAGVIMWRGFSYDNFAEQCFSTALDLGKGRQMPIHYGSDKLNYHTVSSPLGTQIPHAAGAAYALAREKKPNVVIVYFGDGAASEGDFHSAMNFAACLSSPVIFFCRNNGYAISTPIHDQYRGDGIASRGTGYGMPTVRVDGGDLLAVYEATQEARRMCLEEKTPVLIEAMCYRGGHHSTSDDSTTYRSIEEIEHWNEVACPVARVRMLLERLGVWDSDMEMELLAELRADVLYSLSKAEKNKNPPISEMFCDVYDKIPANLQMQKKELDAHLEKFGKRYNLKTYVSEKTYRQPSL